MPRCYPIHRSRASPVSVTMPPRPLRCSRARARSWRRSRAPGRSSPGRRLAPSGVGPVACGLPMASAAMPQPAIAQLGSSTSGALPGEAVIEHQHVIGSTLPFPHQPGSGLQLRASAYRGFSGLIELLSNLAELARSMAMPAASARWTLRGPPSANNLGKNRLAAPRALCCTHCIGNSD
jgi:hypothetical protein